MDCRVIIVGINANKELMNNLETRLHNHGYHARTVVLNVKKTWKTLATFLLACAAQEQMISVNTAFLLVDINIRNFSIPLLRALNDQKSQFPAIILAPRNLTDRHASYQFASPWVLFAGPESPNHASHACSALQDCFAAHVDQQCA